MKAEKKLHQWLAETLSPCHYQRIEAAEQGIPDVNISKFGRSVWCELKVFTNGRVLLRKEQYAWGMKRAYLGESVWVVAWREIDDTIWLWDYQRPMSVIPYSKYLCIQNMPYTTQPRTEIAMDSILFPKVS